MSVLHFQECEIDFGRDPDDLCVHRSASSGENDLDSSGMTNDVGVGHDVAIRVDRNARPYRSLATHSEIGLGSIAFLHRTVTRHDHLDDALRHALHQRFDRAVQLLQGVVRPAALCAPADREDRVIPHKSADTTTQTARVPLRNIVHLMGVLLRFDSLSKTA
jgi:hypothetical protein